MEEKKRNPATKAKQKYNDKNYERLYPWVQKGKKEKYIECYKKMGYKSMNEFVEDALDEKVRQVLGEVLKDVPKG